MAPVATSDALLAALSQQIGSASVVGLGEDHADAGNIGFRTRLVQHLHEALGFNRVVLEAGLFSCREADAALAAGAPPHLAAARCAFRWQTCSQELAELFEYLAQARRASPALVLSGMDPQLSGNAAQQQLIPQLEAALGAPLGVRSREAITHLFDLNLVRSADERQLDQRLLEQLASHVNGVLGANSFWGRVLDGLRFLDEDHWSYQQTGDATTLMGNARDLQMATNVLWLKQQHPGERWILLAANGHLQRRIEPDMRCEDPTHHHGPGLTVPMGHTLAEALGTDYFVLGMSAASGARGMPRAEPEPLGPAQSPAIEFAALDAEGTGVLLDRTALQARGAVPSIGLGVAGRSFSWAALYDAVWVSKTTTPHRVAPTCPPKS